MVFINASQSLGIILLHGSQNVTGGIIATLFFIFVLLIIIAMMFNIPFEFTAIIMLPLALACGSYYSSFLIPVVIILIYFSTIVTKNWIFSGR